MRPAWSVCLVLAAAPGLAAQQPADTATLNPVVVTATGSATQADALPVAVTVLSGAALREQGIVTVAEALRLVPAAAVVATGGSYGAQTSLFLRGGESNYVKVLIDGVPQNTAAGPGGAYDLANLTTDNVERIEVVRGPVSALYGSDAVSGVVQIFTRDGRGAAHGSVRVSGGTYGTSELALDLAGGGERAGYALGVSRFASDGIYPIDNQYRNEVVSGRLRFHPFERGAAALSLRYGDALFHFPTDGTGAVVSNNQHQLDRGPLVGLALGYAFSGRLDAQLSADWHRDNYQYAIAPNGPSDSTTFPYASSDWITRRRVDARANLHVRTNDLVTAGAAVEREAMDGTTLAGARTRDNAAVYAQLVTSRERALSVVLGARLDHNQRFGNYATYRAGLALALGARTRAVASVGTGFKEPTFYENFATGFVHGNPSLAPEHSFSWEAGVERTLDGNAVRVRAVYFAQAFRELIDYNAADTVTNYFNVPAADARGVEVTFTARAGAALATTAGYTYLDTQVTRGGAATGPTAVLAVGQPLIRRPTHSASAALDYRLTSRARLVLTARYTGARPDIDYATSQRVTLPGYTCVAATLDYDAVRAAGTRPGMTLNLRVENLFDQAYEEVKNFPARRRTLLFGGQLRFGS